jgi:hypothetical protein
LAGWKNPRRRLQKERPEGQKVKKKRHRLFWRRFSYFLI